MGRLNIRNKLVTGLVLTTALIILSNLITMVAAQRILSHYESSRLESHEKSEPLVVLQNKLLRAAMPVNDFLINDLKSESVQFRRFEVAIEKDFAAVLRSPIDPSVATLIREARSSWREARPRANRILATSVSLESNGYDEMKKFDKLIFSSAATLQRAHVQTEVIIGGRLERVRLERRQSIISVGVLLVLLVGATVVGGTWFARSIVRPIEVFREEVRRFGHGHRGHRISLRTGDEFELLADDFNWMADRLQESQDDLHELSMKDDMTGLYNHREFLKLLSREIQYARRESKPLSLLMIDIDCLKQVNDTLGHLAGDEALTAVAGAIDAQMREVDWAARYGGDEFCVILPGTPISGAMTIAERLRDAIERDPVISKDRALGLGVSIGCAELSTVYADEKEIINAADQALYMAKRSGKNSVSSSTPSSDICPTA